MNRLEALLKDELSHLVDRIATATREGTLGDCACRHPELRFRLDAAESRLSAARENLLERYRAWREALDECGDFWALADLEADRSGEKTERRAA